MYTSAPRSAVNMPLGRGRSGAVTNRPPSPLEEDWVGVFNNNNTESAARAAVTDPKRFSEFRIISSPRKTHNHSPATAATVAAPAVKAPVSSKPYMGLTWHNHLRSLSPQSRKKEEKKYANMLRHNASRKKHINMPANSPRRTVNQPSPAPPRSRRAPSPRTPSPPRAPPRSMRVPSPRRTVNQPSPAPPRSRRVPSPARKSPKRQSISNNNNWVIVNK